MKLARYQWLKPILWGLEIVIILSLVGSIITFWKKKDIVTERQRVLLRVEAENQRLKEKLSEVQSQTFIEREAREKLGLVKPGEVVVLVGPATPSAQKIPEAKLSNWKQWWQLFF